MERAKIPMPELGRDAIAISFRVGMFLESGGGALIKWLFADGNTSLTGLPLAICPDFRKSLERSIRDQRYPDTRRWRPGEDRKKERSTDPGLVFLDHQPDMSQSDFDALVQSRMVTEWVWHAAKDGIVLDLGFDDGHRRRSAFTAR